MERKRDQCDIAFHRTTFCQDHRASAGQLYCAGATFPFTPLLTECQHIHVLCDKYAFNGLYYSKRLCRPISDSGVTKRKIAQEQAARINIDTLVRIRHLFDSAPRDPQSRRGGLAYRPTRFGSEEGSNCCKRGAKYSSSCVGGGAGGGAGYNLHTSLGKRSDGTGVHASLGVRYPTATAAQIAAQALNRPFHGKPVSSSAAAVRPHQIADPRPKATPNLGAPDALGYSAKPSKNPLMTRRLTTVLTARRAIVPKIASG
jgi:hypothetical protein